MPDLTGLPALDMAIGLAFIFLLLSLLATAVQEQIAAVLALRGNTLARASATCSRTRPTLRPVRTRPVL